MSSRSTAAQAACGGRGTRPRRTTGRTAWPSSAGGCSPQPTRRRSLWTPGRARTSGPDVSRARPSSSSTSPPSSIAVARTSRPSASRPAGAEPSTRSTPARDAGSGGSRRSRKPWPHEDAGGGGAWNPMSVDDAGPRLRRNREPRPVGRHAAVPERRLVRRQHALHRRAGRPGRRHRQGRSGTTRCSTTTSATTTSTSPRSSRPSGRIVGRWSSAPARPAG